MTIEQAIKKSIEGGWIEPYEGAMHDNPLDDNRECSFFLLDPQFWQALGKAMGWGKSKPHIWFETRKSGMMCQSCGLATETKKECNRMVSDWKIQWHKLIDHLAEGKSIEDYFNQF